MALSDEMKKQIAKDAGVSMEVFEKADATSARIMAELLALGLPGGAILKGGQFVYKGLKGLKALKAARAAVKAKKAASKAKGAGTSAAKSAAREGTKAKPQAPGLARNRRRVDGQGQQGRGVNQKTGSPKATEKGAALSRTLSEASKRGAASKKTSGTTSKSKKLVGAAAASGATALGLTAAQLRALRSSEDSTSKKRPTRPKPDQSLRKKLPGGKPGPKRGKLPGGKPGPGKKTTTAAQAAVQEAAARKKSRDAAAKKKATTVRKGPAQASDGAKQRPKRPTADQSRPRGGKVTAKRINESMKDRGKAFQGSYDPKTEVLRNVTVNGKKKTMVFKKK